MTPLSLHPLPDPLVNPIYFTLKDVFRISPYPTFSITTTLIQVTIISHLDYCKIFLISPPLCTCPCLPHELSTGISLTLCTSLPLVRSASASLASHAPVPGTWPFCLKCSPCHIPTVTYMAHVFFTPFRSLFKYELLSDCPFYNGNLLPTLSVPSPPSFMSLVLRSVEHIIPLILSSQ